ncbi:hypothetical protein ACH42_16550 [Endozoicomonas sp. (ex Bugula neritina AB1)]|nr:hypothetical protein ACH42_16550 [Endozoicomonas sp. (ex Bugula neritina AB1)]
MTVVNTPEGKLTADYNVISVQKEASIGPIHVQGDLKSRFKHVLDIQAGSHYSTVTVDKNAHLKSESPYYPVIMIDNTANGELVIHGQAYSDKNSALMYATGPDNLWGNSVLPDGAHKLVMAKDSRVSTGSTAARAIVFENPELIDISDTLSSYRFDPYTLLSLDGDQLTLDRALIQGESIEFGSGSEIIITGTPKLDTPYTLLSADSSLIIPEVSTTNAFISIEVAEQLDNSLKVVFHRKPSEELTGYLRSAGLSQNEIRVVQGELDYGPAAVQNMIYRVSDNKEELKRLSEDLVPDLQHTTSISMDLMHATGNRISQRVMSSGLQSTKVNTGVSMSDPESRQGVWVQGAGSWSEQGSVLDDPGYKTSLAGIVVGYDSIIPDSRHLLGVAAAYHRIDTDLLSSNKIDTDSWLLSLYTESDFNRFGLESIIGYSWNDHHSVRYLAQGKDRSDYKSDVLMFQLLAYLPKEVQPLAGFNLTHVRTDDHKYNLFDQHIKAIEETAVEVGLGARYAQKNADFSPRMQLMLWYNFSDLNLDTQYTIGRSPVVEIARSENREPLSLTGQLGFDYQLGESTLGCDFNGVYRKNFYDAGISCSISYEF